MERDGYNQFLYNTVQSKDERRESLFGLDMNCVKISKIKIYFQQSKIQNHRINNTVFNQYCQVLSLQTQQIYWSFSAFCLKLAFSLIIEFNANKHQGRNKSAFIKNYNSLKRMDNSGYHGRVNFSSFDSDSDFTGRYIKLFEEQTKNSKLYNAASLAQKKTETILPNEIYQTQPQDIHHHYQQTSQSALISQELEKMREQHMRIMRIMDEEPSKSQNFHSEADKYISNKNNQIKSPFQSPPQSMSKLQHQNQIKDKQQAGFTPRVKPKQKSQFKNNRGQNRISTNIMNIQEVQSKVISQSQQLNYSPMHNFADTSLNDVKQSLVYKIYEKQILTPNTVLQDISEEPRSQTNNELPVHDNNHKQRQPKLQENNSNELEKPSQIYVRKGSLEDIKRQINEADRPLNRQNSIRKIEQNYQNRIQQKSQLMNRPGSSYKNQYFSETNNNSSVQMNLKTKKPNLVTSQKVLHKQMKTNSKQVQRPISQRTDLLQTPQQNINHPMDIKIQPSSLHTPQTHSSKELAPHIYLKANIHTGSAQLPIQERIFRQNIPLTTTPSSPPIVYTIPSRGYQLLTPHRSIEAINFTYGAHVAQNQRFKPAGLPHHNHNNQRLLSPQGNLSPRKLSINNEYYSGMPNPHFMSTDANFFNPNSSIGFSLNGVVRRQSPLSHVRSISPRLMSPRRVIQHSPSHPIINFEAQKTYINQPAIPIQPKPFITQINKRPFTPARIGISRPSSNYLNTRINRPISVHSRNANPYPVHRTQIPLKIGGNQIKYQQIPIQNVQQKFTESAGQNWGMQNYNITVSPPPSRPSSVAKKPERGISVSMSKKK